MYRALYATKTATDNPDDKGTTYLLSKDNWRKHWACMTAPASQGGRVLCWYPEGGSPPFDGLVFVTSGNRWEIHHNPRIPIKLS